MSDAPRDPAEGILADLLHRLRDARAAAISDPFGDPVLSIALAVSRRFDDGRIDEAMAARLIARMAETAAAGRAQRLAAYVGLGDAAPAMAALAARLVRPDLDDSPVPFAAYRDAVERPRFAAVFAAHPTFSSRA
jgi:phosphoenolpyruvate carboxylase